MAVGKVELSHSKKVAAGKPATKFLCERMGKSVDDFCTVTCAIIAILFFLDNVSAQLKTSVDGYRVCKLSKIASCMVNKKFGSL